MGCKFIVKYLHQTLCANEKENILQTNLFIVLECVEIIAQLRVASIFFLAVIVPWRWLAGKSHSLGHRDWGEKDMSVICDLVYQAFRIVEANGETFLDEDFIMNIFSPLYSKLPEFEQYLKWYFEEKASYPVGMVQDEHRILAIDETRAELFYPNQASNRQTKDFCERLASKIGYRVCTEMLHPKKALRHHLSVADGKYSKKMTTEEVRRASVGLRANNDPSERNFGVFSDAFQHCRGMGIGEATALGTTRDNDDFGRGASDLVTGKRSKAERDGAVIEAADIGLFHEMPTELTDTLIVTSKRHAKESRRRFTASLDEQAAESEKKMKALRGKKLTAAQGTLIDAMYLNQQYNSPRCWLTEKQAFEEFEKLRYKKDRMAAVKEQILMRYLGLGWVEAHHPWSKKGHGSYSATELFDHFVTVVLPLADTHEVPDEPPLKLPGLPTNLKRLGTRAQDCVDLAKELGSQERKFRLDALRKRDQLEENGFGDQLSEMQQLIWPVEKLRSAGFKIDKLFEYKDGDENVLQWCQGTVKKLVREKENSHMIVEVEWNSDCLGEGDPTTTKEKLSQSQWNPERPINGGWREDLHHKILKKLNILSKK